MRTVRVAVSAVLVAMLAACGTPSVGEAAGDSVVAVQAGATGGGPDADGGDAGSTSATPADKPEDAALATCLARNDSLIPWQDDSRVDMKDWNDRGAGPAHVQIMSAVDKGLGVADEGTRDRRLTGGLLNYWLDPRGSRLLVQIDPAVLDPAEFRSLVDRLAKKANADVRGEPLRVDVQEGCFSARELTKIRDYLADVVIGRDHLPIDYSPRGSVEPDGRAHIKMRDEDRDYGDKLQSKFGPALAIEYGYEPGGGLF